MRNPENDFQSQRSHSITISLTEPPHIQRLTEWFVSILKVIDPHDKQDCSNAMFWLIHCGLMLNCRLLQYGSLPIFRTGHLTAIKKQQNNPNSWTLSIAAPYIENTPLRCYSLAIEQAFRITTWCNGNDPTNDNIETLYQTIKSEVGAPLHSMIPAGKSTIPVLRAAYLKDIPFIHIGAGVYQLGWGSQSRRLDRSISDADSAIGYRLAQNKVVASRLIHMAGLPGPQHYIANDFISAYRAAERLGWPVVVKPLDRDRGEGVSVEINNETLLKIAFDKARKLSTSGQVIVEKEVPGVCHRILVSSGQLLYAVKRLPKSIHCDGISTIQELIKLANEERSRTPPWNVSEIFPNDNIAEKMVSRLGYNFNSTPPKGTRIPLRIIESTIDGGYDEDVTESIHPENCGIAIRAASLFNLDIVGIDIISPDITTPWYKNGAIINEVNFAPLLGGGEISRAKLPIFLDRYLKGTPRIPIEVFVGDDEAFCYANSRKSDYSLQGKRTAIVSHKITLDQHGQEVIQPFEGLSKRCQSILIDQTIDALIIVVQNSELLSTGLCIDRISKLTIVNKNISHSESSANDIQRVIEFLKDKLRLAGIQAA